MEKKPKLEKMSFTFSQEGNCIGSTEEYEDLTIECESSMGVDHDKGCFFVLKTTTGWSIDSESDLKELFDRIKKVIIKEDGNE
jgi:hypothetical protein